MQILLKIDGLLSVVRVSFFSHVAVKKIPEQTLIAEYFTIFFKNICGTLKKCPKYS